MGPYLAEGTHVHRTCLPPPFPALKGLSSGKVSVCASIGQIRTLGHISGPAVSAFWELAGKRAKGLLLERPYAAARGSAPCPWRLRMAAACSRAASFARLMFAIADRRPSGKRMRHIVG